MASGKRYQRASTRTGPSLLASLQTRPPVGAEFRTPFVVGEQRHPPVARERQLVHMPRLIKVPNPFSMRLPHAAHDTTPTVVALLDKPAVAPGDVPAEPRSKSRAHPTLRLGWSLALPQTGLPSFKKSFAVGHPRDDSCTLCVLLSKSRAGRERRVSRKIQNSVAGWRGLSEGSAPTGDHRIASWRCTPYRIASWRCTPYRAIRFAPDPATHDSSSFETSSRLFFTTSGRSTGRCLLPCATRIIGRFEPTNP
jgi:hypothetical protein